MKKSSVTIARSFARPSLPRIGERPNEDYGRRRESDITPPVELRSRIRRAPRSAFNGVHDPTEARALIIDTQRKDCN